MLKLTRRQWLEMLAESWARFPLECCGLLIGLAGGDAVERFVPIRNEAESSRIYRLDGAEYIRAVLAADDEGFEVIGVMHSHTHTAAYPSETDVAGASNPLIPPSWHWVIVGLGAGYPELHSYRIADGVVTEEPVGW